MAAKAKGKKGKSALAKLAVRKKAGALKKPAKKALVKKAARKRVSPVPAQYHNVNAHLWVKNADEALGFYKKALGVKVLGVMRGPGGQGVMHAEMRLGDTLVMLADEWPDMHERSPAASRGTTASLYCYVPNCDALFKRALRAGAKEMMPMADQFWGDRMGKFEDPFGHVWSIATRKEEPTVKEVVRRQEAFFASMREPGLVPPVPDRLGTAGP